MNKLNKAKTIIFSSIIITAIFSLIFHALPYNAIWLWFPILVLVNHWLDWYAEKRGMILSDEMTRQRTGIAAWWTFQGAIALIFVLIVYYDYFRAVVDPRYILAYIAGYMGIVFLVVYTYYNIKQGVWD